MRRPSIKVALIGITLAIAALFGGFAFLSINGLGSLNTVAQDLADNWLPSVKTASRLDTDLTTYRLAIAKHILARSDAETLTQEKAVADSLNATLADIEASKPLISSEQEKQLLTDIETQFAAYREETEKVLVLSRASNDAEAKNMFNDKLVPLGASLVQSVDKLVEINVAGAAKSQIQADVTYSAATTTALVASIVVAILLIATIGFIVIGVANPIVRITGSMRTLAEGDTEKQIPFSGRQDEIGSMAAAVELFRQAAITNKRLEQEAEAARKRAEADRISDQQKAEADATERLRIATSGLADGLKRLASGDLAFQLNDAFAPDFEPLRHDFNQSVRDLGETMSMISESIGTLDDGTREISSGARDLSKRTEQQAASLEETAAALDQITANVANSSKRTEETRSLANQANQSAVKSAEVVSHAEEAMRRIEASSQQIANIIGVIDEIAFQTNLLALNAGVEAARAGDAGKGFAVVAQEVRELAQRSAQAAKEIKGLIQNSTVEVEGGVKLVRDTGTALGTICTFINDINHHVDAISTSAKEQATGLAEVNTAVNSMDQTTQQNAAMVEQSTAASSSLAQEAERLRDLVMRFKLEGGGSHVAALRQVGRTMAEPVRQASPVRKPMSVARGAGRPTNVAVAGDWQEF